MDATAAKTFIEQQLQDAGVTFTEAAVARLTDARYLRAEQLESLSDSDAQAGLKTAVDAAIKRFRKRAKRSTAESVKMREIDTRPVARNLFGKVPPFAKLKPAPEPEPEAPEENAANAEAEASA